MRMNLNTAGWTLGGFFGLIHLAWALMVAAGWGQPVADLVLRLHFIDLQVTIAPFNAGAALLLVVLTTISGFLGGVVLAALWNLSIAAPAPRTRRRRARPGVGDAHGL
ncbi:hypothetical protein C5708_03025 [Caulobacter sp. CCUG 60055]|uniref:hypothetical protein n=1 Tax=Caulobacter sp. CCUG 60055 TaxID=2100090 RepID=UPI001FA6D95B|nr:hypothetical protein [Caulobacter sp. CCUG 60055]MCI3179218.1 hypothetical protein [Caulobacter sp. CCUG 60055]